MNVGSVLGLIAMKDRAAYCASKGGVTMLTKAMALDHAHENVRVNCICPSIVETELVAGTFRRESERGTSAAEGEDCDRFRWDASGRPEDVAEMAVFLASEESSWVTGAAIPLDGGTFGVLRGASTNRDDVKRMSKEEKRVTETALRRRMKESRSTDLLLGFDVESVHKGRAIFGWTCGRGTSRFMAWCTEEFWRRWRTRRRRSRRTRRCRKGTEIATVELKINYLEPVPGGRIKADGRVLRAGRNFVVTECEIFKEDGTLAAKALLTFGAAAGHSITQSRRDLLVATLSGFFAIFVDVLDDALEDEQIGAALAGELDAIAVVPLDGAAKNFAIVEHDGHGGMGLHLLDPVEILRVRGLRRSRFLAGDAGQLCWARGECSVP